MKKSISILALLVILSAGAFAQGINLSAGGGLLFDWSGNNGIKVNEQGVNGYMGIRNTSIGGYVFFDATYVEMDVSFAYGSISGVLEGDFKNIGISESDMKGSMTQLGFSLLGKYPIDMGGFTLFPLLGINYNLVLSMKDKDGNSYDGNGDKSSDWSQFGFLGGLGADFNLTNAVYLRAEGMLDLRLASKVMKDSLDAMSVGSATLGVGPRIKVGVGYKF